jgi:hypothetical protein
MFSMRVVASRAVRHDRLVPHEDEDAEADGHRDQRRGDLPDAHAARPERDELVLPGEESEPDERADEHRRRHHLGQHERDLEHEEARDRVGGHVAARKPSSRSKNSAVMKMTTNARA